MKAVILAGGYGTRLSEETHLKPKPMIEIGGKPILWHIMKIYSHYGIDEFIICLGYKGYVIKEYFANYCLHASESITFDLKNNTSKAQKNGTEPWKVTLVDTGEGTMTGGRIKRIADYLGKDDTFCLTYGDGVANIDIAESIKFHKKHGKLATLSAVHFKSLERFGMLEFDGDDAIKTFKEKPRDKSTYINGGFFVLNKKVLDYIDGDDVPFERAPLSRLTDENQLMAFKHEDFWQCMDTQRDMNYLNGLWDEGKAPWKLW